MQPHDLHSRSALAGYDPQTLFNAKVLIAGAGALGQNLALNLALAGIGEINIVDFDDFEDHNATRSPLYPTAQEQAKWGRQKAAVVAHKLQPMMTAPSPIVRYSIEPIQALGDLPIALVDLVFSAVDNAAARSYLSERCSFLQTPLIEGGFHAEILNMAVFGPMADDACYRCLNPEKIGAYSCSRYAREAEEAQIIPAIQNTAAVLAGLQAEAGIQWLHGDQALRGSRVYGNIRTMVLKTGKLIANPECPALLTGAHWPAGSAEPIVLDVTSDEPVEHLLTALYELVGHCELLLPDTMILGIACTNCKEVVQAQVQEWRWLISPLCEECGGPFPRSRDAHEIGCFSRLRTEVPEEAEGFTCAQVGLLPGTIVSVVLYSSHSQLGSLCRMRLPGTIDQLMQQVSVEERSIS